MKLEHHRNGDEQCGYLSKAGQITKVFGQGHRAWRAECFLNQVIKATKPLVDLHIELDLVPGGIQNEPRSQNRPGEPASRQENERNIVSHLYREGVELSQSQA